MPRALSPALALFLLLAAALGGCGEGGDSTGAATAPASREQAPSQAKPNTAQSPAALAREIGQKACAGMTPLQAAKRYELAARRAGATREFAALVADPPPAVKSSPGFPRLVAALYATTLPARQRADAAAGCVEELASRSSGRQASSDRAR